MTKYNVLVQVLDCLRGEAPPECRSYHPKSGDIEGVNTARSKAFLHLFLKVRFGLLTFTEREELVTEAMHKYRNAILRYNPRSYLEHEGRSVNSEIRSSIENRTSNEFALFNNGITILSDGTFLNERIGQKDRAQLTMINPQIINGGQTAYTLSQVFRDHQEPNRSKIFGEKEVLVKIITFDGDLKLDEVKKLNLIDSISRATNSQSVVSHADRRSNDDDLKVLQSRCFDSFGIWLERKRGEFMDGVREGYIDPALVVDRNLFVRSAAIARGRLSLANAKKAFVKSDFSAYVSAPEEQFRRYNLALQILRWIHEEKGPNRARIHGDVVYKTYIALLLVTSKTSETEASQELISETARLVREYWPHFRLYLEETYHDDSYWQNSKRGGFFNISSYFKRDHVTEDVKDFFDAPAKYVSATDSDTCEPANS